MQIDRRQLAFPVLALGLLSAVPAFAGADEDAVAKNLEAFRAAQAAGNTEVIASICAEELSYSHSNTKIDTKASLLNGITTANYKWTSLEYKDPTIRIVGRRPSCASTLSASRNLPTARKPRRTYTT